eukprot:2881404-Prymnesium_polylepis.1
MPLHEACACKGRLIHAECLRKVIQTVQTHQTGCCSVCKEPYSSVSLLKRRECKLKYNTKGMLRRLAPTTPASHDSPARCSSRYFQPSPELMISGLVFAVL